MSYSLEIVKRTGSPEIQFDKDFQNAVEYVLNRPGNNNPLRSVKFQRNLYYQNVDTVANPDCLDSVPRRELRADYIAFILWGP